MKKLFATTLLILTCGTTYSLPTGNPSDASLLCDGLIWEGHCGDPCDPCLTWLNAFSLRAGFYGDYVFNRHLEIDRNADDSDIEHTKINTNAAFIAANFWDRFDIFATLGATDLFFETNAGSFGGATISRIEIETISDLSWSMGVRGTIWECGCTYFGVEAQYFRTHPNVRRVTISQSDTEYVDDTIAARFHEWQVGVGIAHRINIFSPYIALKWSNCKVSFNDASDFGFAGVTLFDLEAKHHWGFAVGVSLVDCEKASLTVEGRFGDEKAVHVNGQLRF